MQRYVFDEDIIKLERAVDRYVRALDHCDVDEIAAVLADALNDPELDRRIVEINLAYQDEGQLSPLSHDANLVRELVRRHLPSAFETTEHLSQPLTVGEVASYLKEQRRVPFPDREANESLLSSSIPLPLWLSAQEVKKLAGNLGVNASERFWKVFRDVAITLCMGHSHQQAQLAAREQSARKRKARLEPQEKEVGQKGNESE
jgi:hypothetical protein